MNGWQLLDSTLALDTPWLIVHRNHYRLPDGQELDDYYVVSREDFVTIVALDGERVIMVRQYRPGTERQYLCLPGGYMPEGESPLAAAARELAEETGYQAMDSRIIGQLDPMPSWVRSKAYVILCRVSAASRGAIQDHAEIDEVVSLTWEQALAGIASGEINETQAVVALLLARQALDAGEQRPG